MTSQANRKTSDDLKKIIAWIEEELSKRFDNTEISGRRCFVTDGGYYRIDHMCGNTLIVEYAENESEYEKNRFEDGDTFDINYFENDDILQCILKDIEIQTYDMKNKSQKAEVEVVQ